MQATGAARYEPIAELARGGMGTVQLAWMRGATGLDTLVVMKRVHAHLAHDAEFLDMLRDEARITSNIRHPNVALLLDFVEDGESLSLVQEYVESRTLSSVLKASRRRGVRVPLSILSRVLCDTLDGLHAAHTACDPLGRPLGIVHRDATPQNILVGTDGSSRVIDFGIAKAEDRLTNTRVGILKGKVGYIAPEQILGRAVDRRADLFSIGVILHEGLTGRRLFEGDSVAITLGRTVHDDVAPPSASVFGLPPRVDALVASALALEPIERFATAAAFRAALAETLPPASASQVAAYLEANVAQTFTRGRGAASVKAQAVGSESEVTVVGYRRTSQSILLVGELVRRTWPLTLLFSPLAYLGTLRAKSKYLATPASHQGSL